MSGEKTEKATPKRREDERKKGNVFQGKEIIIALNLLVMFVSIKLLSKYIYEFTAKTMISFFTNSAGIETFNTDNLSKILLNILIRLLVLILPLLLISLFTSFLLTGIQTKFIFSTKNISFKISRLNPINGLKRKMSVRSAVHLMKSLIIVIVITVVIYFNILEFAKNIPNFYFIPIEQTVFFIASSFFDIFIKVCIVVIAIGVLDFFFQWWQFEKDIKMSKQEIKDEYKMTEGDPLIKSAIKSRQQKMAHMRMMHKIPEADIIIVNPTHFAVALKYDHKKNNAPVVIAKGRDNIALKIKEIATQNDIKIEENPPLARALYQAVEIDKEIPPEFYQAVAEVLSYVYSIKRAGKR